MDLRRGVRSFSEDPMDITDEIQGLKVDQRQHPGKVLCKLFILIVPPQTVERDVDHRLVQVLLEVVLAESLGHGLEEGLLRHVLKVSRLDRLL